MGNAHCQTALKDSMFGAMRRLPFRGSPRLGLSILICLGLSLGWSGRVDAANPDEHDYGITSRGLVVVPTSCIVDAYDQVLFEARPLGYSGACPSTYTLAGMNYDPETYSQYRFQWYYLGTEESPVFLQLWGATDSYLYIPCAWPSLAGVYECRLEYDHWVRMNTSAGGSWLLFQTYTDISDPDGTLYVNAPPPDPPYSFTTVTVNHQSIQLAWKCASPYVNKFYIERKADVTGSETFTQVAELDAEDALAEDGITFEYEDSGLTADTRYVYRIRCSVPREGAPPEYSDYTDEVGARTVDFVLCTP